jgi:type IV secretion system protein VirD4
MGLLIFLVFAVVLLVAMAASEAERRERIKQAYIVNWDAAHGSARFATKKDVKRAGLFKSGGINIGFFEGRKLFVNSTSHILLVAGARAGKLVTILAAAVLSLPKKYSLALFDPKAEITCICAHYLKASGRAVYVLNPYGIWLDRMKGLKQATFNPMSSLDPKSASFHADCDKLAEAICYEEAHTGDSHWITSARLLISGIIAALAKYGAPADKNLVAVRNVITGANGQSVFDFCRECMALKDPYIRQKLARFAVTADPKQGIPGAEDSRELNSIISTADTQTGWIGNEAIAESLKGGANEVSFKQLKRDPGTVISVCLPLAEFSVSDKWFRVLASTMTTDTLKEGLRGKGAPVLAILDEVYQVGYLKVLADAWGMAAGAAALQLWAVYQDVSQIMAQFKTPGWQTMVQNSGAAMYFGVRDGEQTAEFVSKQCGITEVLSQSKNVSIDPRTGEPLVNESCTQTARPLLHPDEVRFGLKPDEMLLFADGLPGVCRATRKPYFRCSDLKGKYRDNPYFQKDGAAARLVRWLFD